MFRIKFSSFLYHHRRRLSLFTFYFILFLCCSVFSSIKVAISPPHNNNIHFSSDDDEFFEFLCAVCCKIFRKHLFPGASTFFFCEFSHSHTTPYYIYEKIYIFSTIFPSFSLTYSLSTFIFHLAIFMHRFNPHINEIYTKSEAFLDFFFRSFHYDSRERVDGEETREKRREA